VLSTRFHVYILWSKSEKWTKSTGSLINEIIPLQGETDEAEFKWSFIAAK